MTVSIQPVTEADLPRLALVDEEAFQDNAMRNAVSTWSRAGPELRRRHLEASAASLRAQLVDDPYNLFSKAVDDATGRTVGWSILKKPGFMTPLKKQPPKEEEEEEEEGRGEEKKKPEGGDAGLPPCMVVEEVTKFMTMFMDALTRHMGDRDDYFCLAKFSVLPEGIEMGADEALVQHMLARADAEGRETYVGSPPGEKALMERHGFATREGIKCLDGSWIFSIMTRDARPR